MARTADNFKKLDPVDLYIAVTDAVQRLCIKHGTLETLEATRAWVSHVDNMRGWAGDAKLDNKPKLA